ncbi:MAG: D-alanyl-D-alanine carboxypeptidase [Chlamydiales bacterium]|nr:D-alanyl-D-alanine carboxypeptidase [Chlamydiales bacterium]
MKRVRHLASLFLLTPCLLFSEQQPAQELLKPKVRLLKSDISAPYAILMDAETGRVLYAKNAHTPAFPASTTKVATAIYALSKKAQDLNKLITVSSDAVGCVAPSVRRTKHAPYRLEYGGTHMGLKVDEQVPLRDLLYGMMLISGNDAANVIAEYVSGSIPAFISEMNAFLRANGCLQTTYYNPHGLPTNDHKTTAYDLAKMTQVGMRNPLFREIVKTVRYTKPATNKQPETIFVQTNALLRSGAHFYPKAIGVKTGYTQSAGHNIVAAASDENRSLIAVLMTCEDYHQRFKDVTALFEAAFNEKKVSRTVFAKGFDPLTMKVKGASTLLKAALAEDFVLQYYPSEEPNIKASVRWKELSLPIEKGDVVGEIQLIDSEVGKVLKSAPIYASDALNKTFVYQIMECLQECKQILGHKISIIILVALAFSYLIWQFTRRSRKFIKE